MKNKIFLSCILAATLMACAADAQSVQISKLPAPGSGSPFLTYGDIIPVTRGNTTYGVVAGFGNTCSTHQWVNSTNLQGVGACTQPQSSDISGLGTAATVNIGTSGATIPLLNGANVFSGNTQFTQGVEIGSPTGGMPSAGTLNVAALQVNGAAVTAGGINALTGDVTATGPGSVAATLATVNSAPGSYGSASVVPVVTVNGKGLATAIGTAAITPAAIGAPTTSGTGASGTWAINVTGNAGTVTTNANLTGDVTSTGNATSIAAATVTGKALTGYVSGTGTISPTDTILSAIEKLNGNISALVSGVSSVFGRTGAVTAQSGDYTVSQVTGAAPLASPTFTGTVTAPTIVGSLTGSATSFTGSLAGDVTGTQGATAIGATTVTGKVLTGFSSTTGTITAADTILTAIDKLNGNLTAFVVNLATGVTGTLGIANGGTGAASSWLALTNLTGNQYISSTATEANIQTAANALILQYQGLYPQRGRLVLAPNSSYTISNGLQIEADMMTLDCQGSVLNGTGIGSGKTVLSFQNLQGPSNSIIATGQTIDCGIVDYNGNPLTNGETGYLVGGTPTANPTLSSSITSSSSTITVSSATNLPTNANFSIKIDNEYILVQPASGTTLTVVNRGWLGTTAASHSSGASVVSQHSASAQMVNSYIQGFNKNINLYAGSWLANFDHVHSSFGGYCFYSNASGYSNAGGENASLTNGSVLDSCYDEIYLNSTIVRADDTSFDYFLNDGAGGSSISHLIDLHGGAVFQASHPHYEFSYGTNVADTDCPINLADANTTWMTDDGKFFGPNTGGATMAWKAPICSNNSSQTVIMRNMMITGMSPAGTSLTADDAWMYAGDTTYQTETGYFKGENLISASNSNNDVPAAPSLSDFGNANWFINGAGYPYGELVLSGRSKATGTITTASQSGSDGTVTPRAGSGQTMLKISGNGTFVITMPNYGTYTRNAWGFYLNAAEISAGTVTVSVIRQGINASWNGTNTVVFNSDARASTSSAYSVPTGSNAWNIVSWKQMFDQLFPVGSYNSQYYAIVITLSGTSGNLYLDNAFWGVQ